MSGTDVAVTSAMVTIGGAAGPSGPSTPWYLRPLRVALRVSVVGPGVADLLNWMTLFGLGLVVGGIGLVIAALRATGRFRDRRTRRPQPLRLPPRSLPGRGRRPLAAPAPPPARQVRRGALLADTVLLDEVAPAWATAVPGALVPPAPPQTGAPAGPPTMPAVLSVAEPPISPVPVPAAPPAVPSPLAGPPQAGSPQALPTRGRPPRYGPTAPSAVLFPARDPFAYGSPDMPMPFSPPMPPIPLAPPIHPPSGPVVRPRPASPVNEPTTASWTWDGFTPRNAPGPVRPPTGHPPVAPLLARPYVAPNPPSYPARPGVGAPNLPRRNPVIPNNAYRNQAHQNGPYREHPNEAPWSPPDSDGPRPNSSPVDPSRLSPGEANRRKFRRHSGSGRDGQAAQESGPATRRRRPGR